MELNIEQKLSRSKIKNARYSRSVRIHKQHEGNGISLHTDTRGHRDGWTSHTQVGNLVQTLSHGTQKRLFALNFIPSFVGKTEQGDRIELVNKLSMAILAAQANITSR